MSDNLDDFLRQAAERRAKRQQEKNTNTNPRTAPPSTPPTSSTSQPPRPRQVFNSPNAPAPNAPIPSVPTPPPTARSPVGDDVASDVRPSLGKLGSTLSGRHVESKLEYADERMESHLSEAFGNSIRTKDGVRTLRQSEPAPGSTGGKAAEPLINAGDLKVQLRNPQTLRLAILAQEVLKRPYQ